MLLTTTWTWGNTWAVTGLGFATVLVLLFFLVFILMLFGWIMQKLTAPKKPKDVAADDPNIIAAIAMALHLARKEQSHDAPTGMIDLTPHDTAWNPKSNGFNNVGF